jgi:hypothetical protein
LPVDGGREWRRVRDVVINPKDPETGRGVPLRLVRLRPPTLEKLREELHAGQHRPAYPMVHLVSYVADDGQLRLEGANGREELVSPGHLASQFAGARVEIVLLNVCAGTGLCPGPG